MKEKQTTGGTEGEGEERQVKEKKILLRRYWSRDDSPTDTVRERLIASVWRAFERGLTRVKLWSGAFARRFDGSGARPKVAEKKMAVRRQKELQRTILRGLRRAEIKSYHGKELICPSLCLFLFRCLLSFPYDRSHSLLPYFHLVHPFRLDPSLAMNFPYFPFFLLLFIVKMETSSRMAIFFFL